VYTRDARTRHGSGRTHPCGQSLPVKLVMAVELAQLRQAAAARSCGAGRAWSASGHEAGVTQCRWQRRDRATVCSTSQPRMAAACHAQYVTQQPVRS